jgi:phosphate transport system permease protein
MRIFSSKTIRSIDTDGMANSPSGSSSTARMMQAQASAKTKFARTESAGQSWGDLVFGMVARLSAWIVLGILIAIIVSLFVGSYPAIKQFRLGFLTSAQWNPVTQQFGGLVPIVGTLVTSAIAMLIGIPVSFGIALFLTELSPRWLKRPLGTAIELLAAIPSIIYGMWGLFVFAPVFADTVEPWLQTYLGGIPLIGSIFQGPPMGIGILTAGLILAIMVIPFIASVMRDVFEVVPAQLRESAYAVGATTWEGRWGKPWRSHSSSATPTI